MELYAKGQLSFLILNCLQERDFYGLDFISEIYKKSNGRIELKKPSVYSNLTRMEKQGYVSSYLKSSDLGPNRKYYSLTEKGREFYQELEDYFRRNNIDVFRDFKDEDDKEIKINDNSDVTEYDHNKNINFSQYTDNSKVEDEDNDYFDFSGIDDSNNTNNGSVETDKSASTLDNKYSENVSNRVDTNTYSIKSLLTTTDINSTEESDFVSKVNQEDDKITSPSTEFIDKQEQLVAQEVAKEEKKDDAVFLDRKDVEEYNKRLYDISKDINKYKRKKSFAEDQIAFSVDSPTPISQSNEKTKANIEELKNSIMENKGKYGESLRENYISQSSYRFNKNTQSYQDVIGSSRKNDNEVPDDGKFITSRLDGSQVAHARKIEPPRLKIVTETRTSTSSMPAPKRDVTIDPSHKEILSKLYSKTRTGNSDEVREDALYDYNDLKDFYNDQNISFNVYKKPAEKTEHNTNKLYLIVSLITFFVSSAFSAIIYAILAGSDLINSNTNFLYILLPALLLVDIAVKFYNYKKYQGWMPNPMLQQWKVWGIAFLLSALVVGLNFIFGMSPTRFAEFATTTILPIVLVFIVLPLRYYVKRYLLIKYWK